jgi:hypothetical protein
MKFPILELSIFPIVIAVSSNTLSLHSSLNVRDHASQPYSTTDNILVLISLVPEPYVMFYELMFF